MVVKYMSSRADSMIFADVMKTYALPPVHQESQLLHFASLRHAATLLC